jgi:GNAT superfamily N-acetyltransferase
MPALIRPARAEDHAQIAAWTANTFRWGDYVPDRFLPWLEDESGCTFVAEDDGRVVAMARVQMVGPEEAWAQGMRVHPDHRRRGYGTRVGQRLDEWAKEQGARVVRLSVEEWNTNAQGQVEGMGYRRVCDWHYGDRAIGESSPVPEGNGGRRVPPAERLRLATSGEAEPAYLSWIGGELARAARDLLPILWVWRRMTPDHLVLAARNQNLLEGRPGWAITETNEDGFTVHWIETARSDARAMVRALVDRAAAAEVEEMTAMIPAVPWLEREFRRMGFELHPLTVWAKPL